MRTHAKRISILGLQGGWGNCRSSILGLNEIQLQSLQNMCSNFGNRKGERGIRKDSAFSAIEKRWGRVRKLAK